MSNSERVSFYAILLVVALGGAILAVGVAVAPSPPPRTTYLADSVLTETIRAQRDTIDVLRGCIRGDSTCVGGYW